MWIQTKSAKFNQKKKKGLLFQCLLILRQTPSAAQLRALATSAPIRPLLMG